MTNLLTHHYRSFHSLHSSFRNLIIYYLLKLIKLINLEVTIKDMKKIIMILLFMIPQIWVFSQLTFTTPAEPKTKEEVYDSLYNHPKDNVIIGQSLMILPPYKNYNLDYFRIDLNKPEHDKTNRIHMDSIKFRIYDVVKVTPRSYFLKDRETGDTIYYTKQTYSFPFVCLGYYEKQKKLHVGKSYVFNSELSSTLIYDVETGDTVDNKAGIKWECFDLTIDKTNYDLVYILKNEKGEKVSVKDDFFGWKNEESLWEEETANKLKTKFGTTNWNKILNGKIVLGMTKEMVIASWGKPNSINKTSYNEQWVYEYQYLYFTNGKLTDFN